MRLQPSDVTDWTPGYLCFELYFHEVLVRMFLGTNDEIHLLSPAAMDFRFLFESFQIRQRALLVPVRVFSVFFLPQS